MRILTSQFRASNVCIREGRNGETVGGWTISGPEFRISGNYFAIAVCHCGTIAAIRVMDAVAGRSRDCGCTRLKENTKHGEGCARNGEQTRLFDCWRGMRQRCRNPNTKVYKWYGGRGITICQEWLDSYVTFRDWALAHGYADNLTLDRINPDGNYCPENCRWLTQSENKPRKRGTVLPLK